jgi:hypothetical protein
MKPTSGVGFEKMKTDTRRRFSRFQLDSLA